MAHFLSPEISGLFYCMEVIFIKKYSIIIALATALLTGTIIWREAEKINNSVQTIVIQSAPETTAATTDVAAIVTAVTTVKTEIKSEKSAESTKTTEIIAEISEECTTTAVIYVDINSAGADEIMQINGIGEYLAGQIIAYRETNGGFRNIEELMNISGIGEKIFEKIRDCVYVENPVYEIYEIDEPKLIAEAEEIIETVAEEATEAPLTLEELAPINLNEADIELLLYLPYVDEELAQAIIDLREEIETFSSPYELLFADGMTEEILFEITKYADV